MTPLQEFLAKVDEYATNNITALMGTIQVTSNERDDLKLMLGKLEQADQAKAREALKLKQIDLGA